jgi:hypothetical protein
MNSHILSESPIHFIDAIKAAVDHDKFEAEDALIMLYLGKMIKKMETYDDISINKIAMSDAVATFKACSSSGKDATNKQRNDAITEFTSEKKTKILNDLAMLEKRLLKIYKNASVEVYRDN